MPIVRVLMYPGRTQQQKDDLAKAITDAMENIAKAKQLEPLAKELECTMAQLALAWCLKNPNVSTVITGASRPEQVTENIKAQEVEPKLESDVLARIEAVLGNKSQTEED